MVGYEKAWGTRMADTLGTESRQRSQKQCAYRRYLQRGIPCKSRGAPGISTKPPPLHHGPRSVVKGVPHRLSLFYADGLVIMSKTLNELLEKLKTWKKGMEAKGLKANMIKTHDKWTGTQPTTGLRQIPLRRLPQRSWQ